LYPLVRAVRERSAGRAVAAAILLAASLVVCAVIFEKIRHAGSVDMYGRSVAAERAVSVLKSLFATPRGGVTLLLAAMALATIRREWKQGSEGRGKVILLLGGLVCLAWNAYFYGEIPKFSMRYALPYWYVGLAMGAYCIVRLRDDLLQAEGRRWLPASLAVFAVLLLAVGLVRNVRRGVEYAKVTQALNVSIATLAREGARVPLVVRASEPVDIEPAFSLPAFVQFQGGDRGLRYLVVVLPGWTRGAWIRWSTS
jgi:hypothetical protein